MTATAAMPLPSHLSAALASAAARLRRSKGGNTVSAIGKTWRASLVSDQRGSVLSRKAESREGAFAQAHRLLDEAEDMVWFHGEAVGVRIEQDGGA
jgi:hypothetical protein